MNVGVFDKEVNYFSSLNEVARKYAPDYFDVKLYGPTKEQKQQGKKPQRGQRPDPPSKTDVLPEVYMSQKLPIVHPEDGKVLGEASPSYQFIPHVPFLMKNWF